VDTIVVLSQDLKLENWVKDLTGTKYLVVRFENFSQVKEFLDKRPVDILLLDLPVRGYTVDELAEEIQVYLPNLTVICLSDKGREEWEDELSRIGINFWVEKPFTLRTLRRILNQAWERVELLRELRSKKSSSGNPGIVEEKVSMKPTKTPELPLQLPPQLPTSYYQETIRKFSKALTYILDLSRLTDLIATAFAEIFEVNKVVLLLKEGKSYKVVTSLGIKKEEFENLIFPHNRGIFGWLEREGRLLSKKESQENGAIERELSILGSEVVLPLEMEGELLGAISVGKKITGEGFSSEELRLLYTMANYSAVALHNALVYRELHAQSRYFQFILESLPSGFLSVDGRGRINGINRKGREILGVGEEILGQNVQKAGSIIADLMLRTLEKGDGFERKEITLPGRKLTIGVTTAVIKNSHGENMGAVMFFRDLTPVKVEEKKVKVKEEENLWKRIAEGVAHEVRNPLVSIKTFSQLLPEKFKDKDFREEFSEMVTREVERLSGMLDLLEKFAHPGQPVKKPESINQIVEEVVEEFRPLAEEKGIKLNLRLDTTNPIILVDRNQISEALHQIVKNAFQAIKDSGRISITVRRDTPDQVEIKVKDNGEGIPLDNFRKIFLPLFTTRFRGLGLGLPYVKKIMELHHGQINIDSKYGQGTEVSLILPCERGE